MRVPRRVAKFDNDYAHAERERERETNSTCGIVDKWFFKKNL